MQALSIIGAMGILGLITLVGALMSVMGSRRIFHLVGSPHPEAGHLSLRAVRVQSARFAIPINAFLFALGVVTLFAGIRGIYRIIWIS